MSTIEGQAGDGHFYVLPLNADGTAVAVEAGSALLVTGSATAANQTSELTKLDTLHTDVAAANGKLDTLHNDVGRTAVEFSSIHVSTPGSDADPNVAPLLTSDARVLRILANPMGTDRILATVIGGTSLTVQPWIWDAGNSKWLKVTALSTLTTASTAALGFTFGSINSRVNKYFYLQAITNTGTVTDLYYGLL